MSSTLEDQTYEHPLAHLKIRLMSSLFLRTEDDLREYALCEGAAHRDEFAFFLLMQPSDYSSEHFSPCPPLLPPSILYSLWKWPSNWFPFFLLCALAVYFPPGTYSDLSEMSFQNITLPLSTFQWCLNIVQIKSKAISRACKTLVTRPFLDINFCTWPLPYGYLPDLLPLPSCISFLDQSC